jgi:hypothetical protein
MTLPELRRGTIASDVPEAEKRGGRGAAPPHLTLSEEDTPPRDQAASEGIARVLGVL